LFEAPALNDCCFQALRINFLTYLLTYMRPLQADEKGKKSKERLEEEKRAILKQRIRPLDIDDADAARLADKAKELLNLITRLESEKYDLEKNYKARQMEVSRPNLTQR